MADDILADARTGGNGRHDLVGMLILSLVGRLAGYEDVKVQNACIMIPQCVGLLAARRLRAAVSPCQMGRLERRWLTAEKNPSVLPDLSVQWIDAVHGRPPPRGIVLDMDSSVVAKSFGCTNIHRQSPESWSEVLNSR
jgi:hypothetical protein